MEWTTEAQEAIKKVPFFVRKRVRARVESEAGQAGKPMVTLSDLKETQQRYLSGMASEIKGYQVETCFGPAGCPNQILPGNPLSERIETVLQAADLLGFLKSKGIAELKFHHEFRVALADCPNACSQPQIKDIGIIAAARPSIGKEGCSGCGACGDICREGAIEIATERPRPMIDQGRCVACGQCIAVCPSGTLMPGPRGYRIQLGGKLGRHPQLARELPGIYDEQAVIQVVTACLELYKSRNRRGERFGELLEPADFQLLAERFHAKV